MAGKQLIFAAVVLAAVFGICSAKTITVGGTTGWTIPSSPSFYSNWASQQTFQVGDVLVFNFPVSVHTVAEVSKANYDSCNVGSTIGPVLRTAPSNITLSSAGTHYFVCTITGHCGANQKLTVVATGPSATSPAPQPSRPSKGGSRSPATSPAGTPSASASPPSPVGTEAPTGSAASTPTASGPAGAAGSTPPAGNFAASTGVGMLSLLSVFAAAIML